MTSLSATPLTHRSVIRLRGADRHGFLQGLISGDISKAMTVNAIYAALLTPQGKFLHDLFIIKHEDSFLIDCEVARAEDLIARLMAYKLRSKISLENLTDAFDVWAVWNGDYATPLSFADPRLPELGHRAFLAKGQHPSITSDFTAYDIMRLGLGIGDGSRDMEVEKSTLAEGNFDFLNGVDWKKGCYVGQELTARMHYRGLAKKRLFPVEIEGNAPPHGTLLDKDSGEMRSSCGTKGLALLKIDAVQQALDQKPSLTHGETRLWPSIPAWMKIDAPPVNR